MSTYSQKLQKAREYLDIVQKQMVFQPLDQVLVDEEQRQLAEIRKWSKVEEQAKFWNRSLESTG